MNLPCDHTAQTKTKTGHDGGGGGGLQNTRHIVCHGKSELNMGGGISKLSHTETSR